MRHGGWSACVTFTRKHCLTSVAHRSGRSCPSSLILWSVLWNRRIRGKSIPRGGTIRIVAKSVHAFRRELTSWRILAMVNSVSSLFRSLFRCVIDIFKRLEIRRRVSLSSSASTLNEQSAAKSDTLIYQHPVADARTRESCQDLAGYFSEVDPDEPSTSATNTELSASTSDRDAERTEPSKTSRNSVPRCRLYSRDRYKTHVTFAIPSEMETSNRSKSAIKSHYFAGVSIYRRGQPRIIKDTCSISLRMILLYVVISPTWHSRRDRSWKYFGFYLQWRNSYDIIGTSYLRYKYLPNQF